jgi:hypothetical protein
MKEVFLASISMPGDTDRESRWYNLGESWQCELIGMSYLLAQLLCGSAFPSKDRARVIDLFFEGNDQIWFTLELFELEFLAFLSRQVRSTATTLEEDLVQSRQRKGDYEYGHLVRC